MTALGPTSQSPRTRPDGEVLTTEDSTQVPKKIKPTGSSPGLTTPDGKGGASKERAHEPGQARASSTPAFRPPKATPPGAQTSTAADTLASLAEGAMSLGGYQEECKAAKAKRSRRGPVDHPPAKPSPAAAAPDKPKKSKSSSKPVETDKLKGKAINKKKTKGKAVTAQPSDSDADTWDESPDSDEKATVDQPPVKVTALSGVRKVRPSLSPPRFSNLTLYEGKSSKHPTPPYPSTWGSVGFGLTLQQLALGQLATILPSVVSKVFVS